MLAQLGLIEGDARDLFHHRDQLLPDLLSHVLLHLVGDLSLGLIGNVEHHRRTVVEVLEVLEPLHEHEAAGVAQEKKIRGRERFSPGSYVPLEHHAHVALHVGAHVLAETVALGLGDVVVGELPHPALEGVDLRIDGDHVEGADELGEVPGYEGVHDLAPVLGGVGHLLEIGVEHLLLHHHALFLLARGPWGRGRIRFLRGHVHFLPAGSGAERAPQTDRFGEGADLLADGSELSGVFGVLERGEGRYPADLQGLLIAGPVKQGRIAEAGGGQDHSVRPYRGHPVDQGLCVFVPVRRRWTSWGSSLPGRRCTRFSSGSPSSVCTWSRIRFPSRKSSSTM